MTKTKIYYFAYGSNLSEKQMKKRCPHSVAVAKARIKNYSFAITGYSPRWRGGGATIIPKPGAEVWGVVYELDDDCLRRLDGFERLRYKVYARKRITCFFANGRKRQVFTYIREPKKLSHSSKKYRSVILSGAKNFDLPVRYIEQLSTALS